MAEVEDRTFRYTAHREPYLSFVIPLVGLMAVEGGVAAAILAAKVTTPSLRWALLGLVLFLNLVVWVKFFAPLVTRHRVAGGRLELRYGMDVQAGLELDEVETAEAVEAPLEHGAIGAVSARFDRESGRLRIAFSERGQVLLHLAAPRQLRLGLRGRRPVREVLLNVDERDRFLAAIGHGGERTGGETSAAEASPPAATSTAWERGAPTSSPEDALIRTEGLSRRFGDRAAVSDLGIAVAPGEIYALLGPNGAGKTTTLRMLVGLLEPSAGRVYVGGFDMWRDPDRAKAELGYVPDRPLLYERLTAREMLIFLGRLRAVRPEVLEPRIEALLAELDLGAYADEVIRTFSLGTRKKVQLAAALLPRPRVLVLDEPLSGLDPRVARRLKELLLRQSEEGVAILLSTHHLDTAEELSHRVGILHQGRLVLEGPAAEVRQRTATADLEAAFLRATEPDEPRTVR